MVKAFFIIGGLVAALFLINAYAPSMWSSGFRVPVGTNGFHVPWALCMLGGVLTFGLVKLKTK